MREIGDTDHSSFMSTENSPKTKTRVPSSVVAPWHYLHLASTIKTAHFAAKTFTESKEMN